MRGLVASFGHALSGVRRLLFRERNGRIHLALAVAVVLAGLAFGISRADWLWIVAAIALVWTAEALNTALETLCDTLHPERAEGIRHTKDLAAGAVLVAALGAVLIGGLVFFPYVFG